MARFCRTRGVREALFYYWKRRLREAAMPQFVEVQVAKPQLRAKHSCSALESRIEVRLRKWSEPDRTAGVRGESLASLIGGSGVGVMIGLPSLPRLTGRRGTHLGNETVVENGQFQVDEKC